MLLLAFCQHFFRQNSLNQVLPKVNNTKVSSFTVNLYVGRACSYALGVVSVMDAKKMTVVYVSIARIRINTVAWDDSIKCVFEKFAQQ